VSITLGRVVFAVSPDVNFHPWGLANAMYDGRDAGARQVGAWPEKKSSLWTNLARSGDPNGRGLPR
jgi:hypothetical protein